MKIIDAIASIVTRLVLLIVAAVFAIVLLCFALLGLVWILLKALLTGRKPVFVTSFMQFRQATQQFNRGAWSNQNPPGQHDASSGEIIEGQATEIRDDPVLPHDRDNH